MNQYHVLQLYPGGLQIMTHNRRIMPVPVQICQRAGEHSSQCDDSGLCKYRGNNMFSAV